MNGCYTIEDFNIKIEDENKGFKHNLQSARVVTELEQEPLNLTKETIWGIIHHSSTKSKPCKKNKFLNCKFKHKKNDKTNEECSEELHLKFYNNILENLENEKSWTFEGLIVTIADEIAQRHHDIEDAIDFKILTKEEICCKIEEIFGNTIGPNHKNLLEEIKSKKNKYKAMSDFSRFIVDFLTTNLINNSKNNLIKIKGNPKWKIITSEDFYSNKEEIFHYTPILEENNNGEFISKIIQFSDEVKKGDEKLQEFLSNKILHSEKAQRMDGLGSYVIGKLFEAYTHNPQQLSDKTIGSLYKNIKLKEDELKSILEKTNGDKTLIKTILEKLMFIDVDNVGDKRDFIPNIVIELNRFIKMLY